MAVEAATRTAPPSPSPSTTRRSSRPPSAGSAASWATRPSASSSCGETFTLRDLRLVYEAILGHPLNKDSFRRTVLDRGAGRAHRRASSRASAIDRRSSTASRVPGPRRRRDDARPLLPPALAGAAAVLTGIACVALTVRQHIANWPVGICQSALFLVLFLGVGLYADSMLQVVYIGLGLLRLVALAARRPDGRRPAGDSASPRLRVGLVGGAVAGGARGLGTFLATRDGLDGPLPRRRHDGAQPGRPGAAHPQAHRDAGRSGSSG